MAAQLEDYYTRVKSPVRWVGGKFYSAKQIIGYFPHHSLYDTYLEPFGGGASVLFCKPPHRHFEIYNDFNSDLVNFWRVLCAEPEILEQYIKSIPYSREVFTEIVDVMKDPEYILSDLDRAAYWFYMLRSSFGAIINRGRPTWGYKVKPGHGVSPAEQLHNVVSLFPTVANRLKHVQFDNRDFQTVLKTYARNGKRMLIYADPPYMDAEDVYGIAKGSFPHEALAQALNASESYVALSYYPHPDIDKFYPPEKWRKETWGVNKLVANAATLKNDHRPPATEILLCNYPAHLSKLSIVERPDAQAELV